MLFLQTNLFLFHHLLLFAADNTRLPPLNPGKSDFNVNEQEDGSSKIPIIIASSLLCLVVSVATVLLLCFYARKNKPERYSSISLENIGDLNNTDRAKFTPQNIYN